MPSASAAAMADARAAAAAAAAAAAVRSAPRPAPRPVARPAQEATAAAAAVRPAQPPVPKDAGAMDAMRVAAAAARSAAAAAAARPVARPAVRPAQPPVPKDTGVMDAVRAAAAAAAARSAATAAAAPRASVSTACANAVLSTTTKQVAPGGKSKLLDASRLEMLSATMAARQAAAAAMRKSEQAAASVALPASALNEKGKRATEAAYFAATDECLRFDLSKSPAATSALKDSAFDRDGRFIVPGQYEWLTPRLVTGRRHVLALTAPAKDPSYNYVHDSPALGFTVAFVSYVQTWEAWMDDHAPVEHLHRFLGGDGTPEGKNWYARCAVVYQDEVAALFDPERYRVDPTGLAMKADSAKIDLTEDAQVERAHARKSGNLCVLTGHNHVQVQPKVCPLPLAVGACPDLGAASGMTQLRSGRIVDAGTAFVHGAQIMQHEMHAMLKELLRASEQSYATDVVVAFMKAFKAQPADALNDAICAPEFLESEDAEFSYCPASHGMYTSYRWDKEKLKALLQACCDMAWEVVRETWEMHPTLGAWMLSSPERVEHIICNDLYTIVYGIFYPASLGDTKFHTHSQSLTDRIIAERDERVDLASKIAPPAHMDKDEREKAVKACKEGYTDGFGSSAALPFRRKCKTDPMQIDEIEITVADDKPLDDDLKLDPTRRCTGKRRTSESSDSDEAGDDDTSESSDSEEGESDSGDEDVPLLLRRKPAEKKPAEKKPAEKKPAEKKPAEKKPVLKKPVPKKLVPKKENDSDSDDDNMPLTKIRKIDPLLVERALVGGRTGASIVLTERHGLSCSRSGAKYRAGDEEVVETFTFDVVGAREKALAQLGAAVQAAENVHGGFDFSVLLEELTWGHLFLIARHKAGDVEERGDADDAAFLDSIEGLLAGDGNGINEVRVMAGPDGVACSQRCTLATLFANATTRNAKLEKTDIEKVLEWRQTMLRKALEKDEGGEVASLLSKKRARADDDDDDDDDDRRTGAARVARLVMEISRRHDVYMSDARAEADEKQVKAEAEVETKRKELEAAQAKAATAAKVAKTALAGSSCGQVAHEARAKADKAVARAQVRLSQAEAKLAKRTAAVAAAWAQAEGGVADDCESDSDGEEMVEDEEQAAVELDTKLTELRSYVLNGARIADLEMDKWLYELAEMEYEHAYDTTYLAFVHMLAVRYRTVWDTRYAPPVRPDEFAIETREGLQAEFARRQQAAVEAVAEAMDDEAPLRK